MIIWVLLGFFTMGLPLMLTKPEIVCLVVKDEITLEEYCEFNMDNINKRERLGHTELFQYRLKHTILNYYITIMVDYFYQTDYANNNFFTTTEVKDIMNRINSLCDSNYDLDL